MNPDLLNILANSNKDIDNQKIMDYLSGKLSEKERHEIEQLVAGNSFMNDALEGLEGMADARKLSAYVEKLNSDLRNQLEKASRRKKRKKLTEQPWTYVALILILLFAITGYFLIRLFLKN